MPLSIPHCSCLIWDLVLLRGLFISFVNALRMLAMTWAFAKHHWTHFLLVRYAFLVRICHPFHYLSSTLFGIQASHNDCNLLQFALSFGVGQCTVKLVDYHKPYEFAIDLYPHSPVSEIEVECQVCIAIKNYVVLNEYWLMWWAFNNLCYWDPMSIYDATPTEVQMLKSSLYLTLYLQKKYRVIVCLFLLTELLNIQDKNMQGLSVTQCERQW